MDIRQRLVILPHSDENYVDFSQKTLDFILDIRNLVVLPHFDENYVDFSQKTIDSLLIYEITL